MEVTQHYAAAKFGQPHISAAEKGVRILDLIRWFEGAPHELPLSPAAERVLDALDALGDRLPLHASGGAGWAKPCNLHRIVKVQTGERVIDPFYDARQRQRDINAASSRQSGWIGNVGADWLADARVFVPRQVAVTRDESVSWLASMRAQLVGQGNRKALDNANFVRLVIPRRLADELFGCGPQVSFWDRQPEPFPMPGPGLYPPPQLQGIRPHDADRWGELLTGEAVPRAVVRVADLVQFAADQAGRQAVRPVAAHVLQLIERDAPGLFCLVQGSTAAAVDPAHVWRARFMSGKEHEAQWQAALDDGFLGPPSIELDEAAARGLTVADDDRCRGSGGSWDREWPELPALVGPAGALQLARVQWVERARTFADLDAGDLGRLVVPLAWAVAKFGRQGVSPESEQATEAQLPAEPPPLAVVAELSTKRSQADRDAREQRARDKFKPNRKPGDVWTTQHFAELLSQFGELTRAGAGALKVAAAHTLLAELWGMGSPNTVKTYLTKAREVCKPTGRVRTA